jgi:hypothetical protein
MPKRDTHVRILLSSILVVKELDAPVCVAAVISSPTSRQTGFRPYNLFSRQQLER